MSEPASISTGIAQRYATAVFDLAREGDDLAALTSDVDALRAAQSADRAELDSVLGELDAMIDAAETGGA